MPSTARTVGAGNGEFRIVNQVAGSKGDKDEKIEGSIVGGTSFGMGAGDLAYTHGLTERVDLGVRTGISGALGGTAKVMLIDSSSLWLSVYGQARTYFVDTDVRLAHGGAIATVGPREFGASIGAFYGGLSGKRKVAGVEEPDSASYFGGGLGFHTIISDFPIRFMFEVQRHDYPDDGVTTGILSIHTVAAGGR